MSNESELIKVIATIINKELAAKKIDLEKIEEETKYLGCLEPVFWTYYRYAFPKHKYNIYSGENYNFTPEYILLDKYAYKILQHLTQSEKRKSELEKAKEEYVDRK